MDFWVSIIIIVGVITAYLVGFYFGKKYERLTLQNQNSGVQK